MNPMQPAGKRPAMVRPQQAQRPASQPIGQLGLPSSLSKFKTGAPSQQGRGIVLIGKAGIGKTSLCAEMPGVLFICDPLETGIVDLIEKKRVNISMDQVLVSESYDETLNILRELLKGGHNVKTVVYEGWTGLEKACMTKLCDLGWKSDWSRGGFLSFQEGPRAAAARHLPEALTLFQKLRLMGINTVITAHTAVKAAANAEGSNYDAELPYSSSKDMWHALQTWAENVIYMIYQVTTQKAGDGKTKAQGGVPNFVCHRTGAYEGKNKFGIQTYLNLDGKDSAECYRFFCEQAGLDPATMYHTN